MSNVEIVEPPAERRGPEELNVHWDSHISSHYDSEAEERYSKLSVPNVVDSGSGYDVFTFPEGGKEFFERRNIKEIEIGINSGAEYAGFEYFPSDLHTWTTLEKLTIASHALKELPSSVFEIPNLKELKLINSGFTGLPEIPENHSLEVLVIDTKVNPLPDSFSNLKALKKIRIGDQDWKELPDSFYDLKSLEEIRLGWVDLEKLSPKLGNFQNLRSLWITSSSINEFPTLNQSLSNLKTLKIGSGSLYSISGLHQLSNPKEIRISSGYFSSQTDINQYSLIVSKIHPNKLPAFKSFYTDLRSIEIRNIIIDEIPIEIKFANNLKKATFFGCQINSVPSEFWLLPELTNINLRTNNLSEIKGINEMQKYTVVNLANNNIKELNYDLIENTQELNLEGNPCYDQFLAFKRVDE